MIKSFRLRLALLSALLAGLALAAFGASSWWLIRNIKIHRIDSEVRNQAEREIVLAHTNPDWTRVEAHTDTAMGIRNNHNLVLLVQNGNGETLYRSPQWPEQLNPATLPWPDHSTPPTQGSILDLIPEAHADDGFASETAGPQSDTAPGFRRLPPGPRFRGAAPFGPPGGPRQDFRSGPAANNTDNLLPLRRRQALQPGRRPVSSLVVRNVDGKSWHIGLARTNFVRTAVAVNAQVIDADMDGIRNGFLIALPIALLLIGFGGWVFSGSALRPLNKLSAATRRVTAAGLDQRIPDAGEDREFSELIQVYNGMLERLERSFKQASRFSADAAHELKTPLAILQGQLERAINQAEAGSEAQAELTGILDEVRRLSTISRKLLLLSQADAGRLSLHREPFDLSRALNDLIEDARMLAPQLQVDGNIHSGLEVNVDGSLVQQVLHNLISNAIKYNQKNGWIHVSTKAGVQSVEVIVANASDGIAPAERDKIFERFYRGDPSHNSQVAGVGLGLSVSREIARAHGGDITLRSGTGKAVQFVLTLPLYVGGKAPGRRV